MIFFNKDGYPHNFQYNQSTEGWEGKIIFDENSDQTFKTQSLHIFESVDEIGFNINVDFLPINYHNNSGMTFKGKTIFQNEIITNIEKVNDSDQFYSKWIYGTDFHKKFPVGTIISFSGVTDSNDFSDDKFFTVLSIKKDAFLIITNTDNASFSYTYNSGTGTTSSLNMISINDYNRNLSVDTFFQNLYKNKKLSIINSEKNDGIISIKQSGITYSYLNEIKLNGQKDQNFRLEIEFFTERPKILNNNVTLTNYTYPSGVLEVGRFASNLAPEITYSGNITGLSYKTIIFEDRLGNRLYNGYEFTVKSLVTTKNIGTKILTFKQYYQQSNNYSYYSNLTDITQWNTIQFSGTTDIKVGDIIQLSGISGSSILMHNRDFSITNIAYSSEFNTTILFTPGYMFDETGSTYNILQKLKPNQITKINVESSGDVTTFNGITIPDAYCYLVSNYLSYSQIYISGVTSSVNSTTIDAFINKYKSTLYHYGIDIYHTIKGVDDYLSIESLYGTRTGSSGNTYFYASGYTNGIKISDNFTLSMNGITNKYNFITNEILVDEKTNKVDNGLYKDEIATEIVFNLNKDTNNFGFRMILNSIEYYIDYLIDTQSTINSFIDKYNDIFYGNGFNINSGYSTNYSGYTLNILSDVDIWNLEITVNILSTYKITNRARNRSILLSGNEIKNSSVNLFNIGLSTGMIVKISGSSYNENNKEYNIISLDEYNMALSYQGVFIKENNVDIYGITREFIRKPRGEYNRDVYLRVYWDIPIETEIDESIFLYDMSGNQLIPYNNNSAYSYTGPKPLIDPLTNNVVLLNKEPNKELSKISNPKYQQTVFDELTFKLEQLDSSTSYNWIPEPLEIFIGYNSDMEGVNTRTLKIEKYEKHENNSQNFSYTGYTTPGYNSNKYFIFDKTTIEYKVQDFNFVSYGFKKDQLIKIDFKDQSKTGQTIFENVYVYKIQDVSRTKITIDSGYTYKNLDIYDTGYTNSNGFTYFNSTGSTFFFKIEVQPKEVLYCPIYGQTEIEDIRYKVNLNNVGIQSEEDVYKILYASDIQDNAIDYTLFNRKRKEMLTTFREIYDYIGSYKSLINAINYFGYNNLQLYEYYQNIDKSSVLYTKLHKVLIPDIFDNTVKGWNEMDFIAGKYQNNNKNEQIVWKKTNLFNLAYRITDEDGNNVLIYTLEEVQYKLTKLKNWLRKNIIPISANLLDITGVADTTQTLYQNYDESNQTMKSVVERNSTVVNFNYTASLNFGSDYLITINFYTMSGATGTTIDINDVPVSFSAKIRTFYLSGSTIDNPTELLVPVQYYKLNKTDLLPFSFNLNKYTDPYIYVETTTYDNSGNGIGYVNNKLFYYDEPRNFWIINNNFDLHKMKYWQTTDYISNEKRKWVFEDIVTKSTVVSSVETVVKVNTLNNTYISQMNK